MAYIFGGLHVTYSWSPLGNFIEGQEHPVIVTNVFSVFFSILYYVVFVLLHCRDLWNLLYSSGIVFVYSL